MPCSDSREFNRDCGHKDEIDKLTRLLCEACLMIGTARQASKELSDWWKEHQRIDREREERESRIEHEKLVRARARAKLTKEERKALGLS